MESLLTGTCVYESLGSDTESWEDLTVNKKHGKGIPFS